MPSNAQKLSTIAALAAAALAVTACADKPKSVATAAPQNPAEDVTQGIYLSHTASDLNPRFVYSQDLQQQFKDDGKTGIRAAAFSTSLVQANEIPAEICADGNARLDPSGPPHYRGVSLEANRRSKEDKVEGHYFCEEKSGKTAKILLTIDFCRQDLGRAPTYSGCQDNIISINAFVSEITPGAKSKDGVISEEQYRRGTVNLSYLSEKYAQALPKAKREHSLFFDQEPNALERNDLSNEALRLTTWTTKRVFGQFPDMVQETYKPELPPTHITDVNADEMSSRIQDVKGYAGSASLKAALAL